VAYLGGDSTTADPAVDTIERYRLTNRSAAACRLGAWVGVTMVGVSGCPAPTLVSSTPSSTSPTATSRTAAGGPTSTTGPGGTPVTVTPTATTAPCPPGPPAPRGLAVRATAWPARDQSLPPGGSTVLSLLFADTFAPQSCDQVWAPPDRLELRPAGDARPLVVPARVYPCEGELVVAPLGYGL
jgi:hypothetical protein